MALTEFPQGGNIGQVNGEIWMGIRKDDLIEPGVLVYLFILLTTSEE